MLTKKILEDRVKGKPCPRCKVSLIFEGPEKASSVEWYSHSCGWEVPKLKGYFRFTIICGECRNVSDPADFGIGGSSDSITNRRAQRVARELKRHAQAEKRKEEKRSQRRSLRLLVAD